MTLCGGKRQLQPTSVAAIVPTRSVLMQIPHQELSPAPISCGDLNFALVLYLLRKSVKCILSARLFSKFMGAPKSWGLKSPHRTLSPSRFHSRSRHSNRYDPHPNSRMVNDGISDYSASSRPS